MKTVNIYRRPTSVGLFYFFMHAKCELVRQHENLAPAAEMQEEEGGTP